MAGGKQPAPSPQNDTKTANAAAETRSAPNNQSWTTAQLLSWTVQRFSERGLPSPRIDAEHLLAHALGCARVELYVRHDMVIDGEERARFRELVRRRLAREPVAYIEGTRGFHALDLDLAVDRRVLVPRPETELLVDWLLETLPADEDARVLDVGTGSGAIALSIKRARPGWSVLATDVSDDALAVASANAERHGIDVTMQRADVYDGLPDAPLSAIVSNPPYIATDVLATLQPEVCQWEPRLALDGGPDGLDVLRRIVEGAPPRLIPGGWLLVEIGYDQGEAVAELMRAAGLQEVSTRKDLGGHVRMVRGQKLGAAPPA